MYVAVKGGEAAIEASWALLARERRGDPSVPALTVEQVQQQLRLAVDRVMTEGGLHDEELAALAIKQAAGDLVEAVFLLRAYRTTLPRFGDAQPLDTSAMQVRRRVSATFKDLPGGQLLGPTYDYTQRLLDFALLADPEADQRTVAGLHQRVAASAGDDGAPADARMPRVTELLAGEGLIEVERPQPTGAESEEGKAVSEAVPFDITRRPPQFPADRSQRLQTLARGDEGFLLALGYSTQRGYANAHPFAGEVRMGEVAVSFVPEELGFEVELGEITVTECQMINQFAGSREQPPQFTQGYGLAFGEAERKAMAMSLVDRALRARELDEPVAAPAQDEEFVLLHADSVEAMGFVQHLKLPHYVDFQAELELVRRLRAEHSRNAGEAQR